MVVECRMFQCQRNGLARSSLGQRSCSLPKWVDWASLAWYLPPPPPSQLSTHSRTCPGGSAHAHYPPHRNPIRPRARCGFFNRRQLARGALEYCTHSVRRCKLRPRTQPTTQLGTQSCIQRQPQTHTWFQSTSSHCRILPLNTVNHTAISEDRRIKIGRVVEAALARAAGTSPTWDESMGLNPRLRLSYAKDRSGVHGFEVG